MPPPERRKSPALKFTTASQPSHSFSLSGRSAPRCPRPRSCGTSCTPCCCRTGSPRPRPTSGCRSRSPPRSRHMRGRTRRSGWHARRPESASTPPRPRPRTSPQLVRRTPHSTDPPCTRLQRRSADGLAPTIRPPPAACPPWGAGRPSPVPYGQGGPDASQWVPTSSTSSRMRPWRAPIGKSVWQRGLAL